jgi:uncharacterized protein YndB with AHSA1/START domain
MLGVSIGLGSMAMSNESALAIAEEISHAQESIHHEVELQAAPQRVYAALTDAQQFQKVTIMSAAVTSGMVKPASAAQLSKDAGGAFSLFGGIISGRIIELVPGQRIVQAWRAADWAPGVYSIARFELTPHGKGTKLVFDHIGFPAGAAAHLAAGWKGNYWEPLSKVLASAG